MVDIRRVVFVDGLPVRIDRQRIDHGLVVLVQPDSQSVQIQFLEVLEHRPVLVGKWHGLAAEMDEESAHPLFARNRHQVRIQRAQVDFRSVRRAVPVVGLEQSAVETVLPSVVGSDDRLHVPLPVDRDLTAIVGTDVVKGAGDSVPVANEQHRNSQNVNGQHVPGIGKLRREGHGEPAFLESVFDFEFMEVLVHEGTPRQCSGLLDGCSDRGSFVRSQELAEGLHEIRFLVPGRMPVRHALIIAGCAKSNHIDCEMSARGPTTNRHRARNEPAAVSARTRNARSAVCGVRPDHRSGRTSPGASPSR